EAIDAVPDELVRQVSLVGPAGFVKERLAAFAEAGVTTMLVHPPSGDRRETAKFVEHLQDLLP
ncbi:LLM class F420-dependent oxidoreductase, partial [Mycobacterium sp. ITM-2017-0098]